MKRAMNHPSTQSSRDTAAAAGYKSIGFVSGLRCLGVGAGAMIGTLMTLASSVWTNGASSMKARTGSIVKRKPRRKGQGDMVGKSYLHRSETGKRHDLQRRGQNKAHARDLLQALLRDIDATDGQASRNGRYQTRRAS